MQIGIDVGATKIESVVLEEDGNEKHRSRTECPKDYLSIISTIKDIHHNLEKEFKTELPIGVCHPGIHSPQTGLVKNAPNCYWLEKKPFQSDLRKALGKELAQKNIAVNCVTPAAAKTRIFDQMTEEHINYMLSKIPRNKFAKVEELASLVTWLSSEENSFSTAAVFDLSGGRATY